MENIRIAFQKIVKFFQEAKDSASKTGSLIGNLGLMLIIGAFIYAIVEFVFIKQSYYQKCSVDSVISTSIAGVLKVKGTNNMNSDYARVWDAVDISQDIDGGIFVATNVGIRNQTMTECREEYSFQGSHCTRPVEKNTKEFCLNVTDQCAPRTKLLNGFATGNCCTEDGVKWPDGVCEIMGWCPPGNIPYAHTANGFLFEGVENFTLMVTMNIKFPECGRQFMKTHPDQKKYNEHCLYDKQNTDCTHFRIGDIVENSKADFSTIAKSSGQFVITINWDCDFFLSTIEKCQPVISFEQLEIKKEMEITLQKVIFNIEDPRKGSIRRRRIEKFRGIKIYVKVAGTGKVFSFMNLLLVAGALKGALDIAVGIRNFGREAFNWLGQHSPQCILNTFPRWKAKIQEDKIKEEIEKRKKKLQEEKDMAIREILLREQNPICDENENMPLLSRQ